MAPGFSVEVRGLAELQRKLGDALDPLRPMMGELAEFVEREAEGGTKPHAGDVGRFTRGDFIRSDLAPVGTPLHARVFTGSPIVVEVDQGRAPGGRPPPVRAIARWAERHGIPLRRGRASPPFLIARAIGRRGSRGVGFMAKAAEAGRRRAPELIREVARVIERGWGR